MNMPRILTCSKVLNAYNNPESARRLEKNKWIPVKPVPFYSWPTRFKATWLVFTGKADALLWEWEEEGDNRC